MFCRFQCRLKRCSGGENYRGNAPLAFQTHEMDHRHVLLDGYHPVVGRLAETPVQ